MRLLHFDESGQLCLTGDLREDLPRYAILSHRWGRDEDEPTFADISSQTGREKIGYVKLLFCGEQARNAGIE